uniref:Uncharacterized protein n=1 Tax=Romanomermis culicivorax TaxID=13658 RepID=A0A915KUX6_ROMCU
MTADFAANSPVFVSAGEFLETSVNGESLSSSPIDSSSSFAEVDIDVVKVVVAADPDDVDPKQPKIFISARLTLLAPRKKNSGLDKTRQGKHLGPYARRWISLLHRIWTKKTSLRTTFHEFFFEDWIHSKCIAILTSECDIDLIKQQRPFKRLEYLETRKHRWKTDTNFSQTQYVLLGIKIISEREKISLGAQMFGGEMVVHRCVVNKRRGTTGANIRRQTEVRS